MRIVAEEMDLIEAQAKAFCDSLMEMGCDSVQIVATAMLGNDRSARIAQGRGNLYARRGAMEDYMLSMRDEDMATSISIALGQDEDGE
jgi:hypothetical protein